MPSAVGYAGSMMPGVVRSALVEYQGRQAVLVPDVFDRSLAQTLSPAFAQIIT
jgi:hypothetical protein